MSWSAVQVGGAASSGQVASLTATFGSGVATGNLLVVMCNMFSASTPGPTVTASDQNGNTWTLHTRLEQAGGTVETWAVFYLIVPSGSNGTALAVTITPSVTTFCNMGIAEFGTGGGTPSADSSMNGTSNVAGNGPPVTPSISVAGSGPDLLIAGAETNATAGHDVTVGSGFTNIFQNNYVPGTSLGTCYQYKLNVTTSQTAAFAQTLTGADRWNCAGCSFKLAPPPGGLFLPDPMTGMGCGGPHFAGRL